MRSRMKDKYKLGGRIVAAVILTILAPLGYYYYFYLATSVFIDPVLYSFIPIIGLSLIIGSFVWIEIFRITTGINNDSKGVRRRYVILVVLLILAGILAIISVIIIWDSNTFWDLYWSIGPTALYGILIFIVLLGAGMLITGLLEIIRFKEMIPNPKADRRISAVFIIFIIGLPSFLSISVPFGMNYGEALIEYDGEYKLGDPLYSFPYAPHFNTALDELNETALYALQTLEIALFNWSRLSHMGGFPYAVTDDFTTRYSDLLLFRNMLPNEISFNGATQQGGLIFLRMYMIEPNPSYLKVAQMAANACIAGQLKNGAWWEMALINTETGRVEDPSALTLYPGHARFCDYVMQGVMRFLFEMWNYTYHNLNDYESLSRYEQALIKGLRCIIDYRRPNAGWPKHGGDGIGRWGGSWSVLNDESTLNNIRALLWAEDFFGDRPETKGIVEAAKTTAFNAIDWLLKIQGNGNKGNESQQGWADQYDKNNQLCWARVGEPPAFSVRATAQVVNLLLEVYLSTGDVKYLDPMKRAVEWLNRSRIAWEENSNTIEGWALYYEPGTNRPIYGYPGGGPRSNPPYYYDYEDALPDTYGYRGYQDVQSVIDNYLLLESLNFNSVAYKSAIDPSIGDLEARAIVAINSFDKDAGFWYTNVTKKDLSVHRLITSWVFNAESSAILDYLEAIL